MADSRAVAEKVRDELGYLVPESKEVFRERWDTPQGLSSQVGWAPTGQLGQFKHQHT